MSLVMSRRGVIVGGTATMVALPVGFYLGRSNGAAAIPAWAALFIWQLGMQLAAEAAVWGFKEGVRVMTAPKRDALPPSMRDIDLGKAHATAVWETANSMYVTRATKADVLEAAQSRLRGLIRNVNDYNMTEADDLKRLENYIEESNYIYEEFVRVGAAGLQASMNALNLKILLVQQAIFQTESDVKWPLIPDAIATAKKRVVDWKSDVDLNILPAIFPKPPPPPPAPKPAQPEGICAWLPSWACSPPPPPPPAPKPPPPPNVEKQRSDLFATAFREHQWHAEAMIKDWERIRVPDCNWLGDIFREGCSVKS